MNDFRRRDDHFIGIGGGVQILNDALSHGTRRAVQRNDLPQDAVFVIAVLVERGDIDAVQPRCLAQEMRLVPDLRLCLCVERENLYGELLAFAEGEEVDELCQRLRIVGAGAAGKHDVAQSLPILRMQGDAGKIQHVQDVGVAHLIADGEGDQIKVPYGLLTFQTAKRQVGLAHGLLHIAPWRKDPLAPDALLSVHDVVQDPHADVRHADLVGVRKTEGDPYVDACLVLYYFVEFAPGIARRLLHRGQNPFEQFFHRIPLTVLWPKRSDFGLVFSIVTSAAAFDKMQSAAVAGKAPQTGRAAPFCNRPPYRDRRSKGV